MVNLLQCHFKHIRHIEVTEEYNQNAIERQIERRAIGHESQNGAHNARAGITRGAVPHKNGPHGGGQEQERTGKNWRNNTRNIQFKR